MKKFFIIALAVLALAACSNDNSEIDNNVANNKIDASAIKFNITISNDDFAVTRGVKTDWQSGDVVYVFFNDNTTQYVKMTYNGTSWAYADKDGGTTYTGLNLSASGKKVSAVYMPSLVIGDATPSYDTGKWTFGSIGGYFLKAESADYTVTSTADVTTLTTTLNMIAPENLVQVYVNESVPASGNEYVLNMTNVKPFTFDGIAPGGTVTVTTGTANFPLTAYNGTMGNDAGYYFWGILNNASAGATDYNFQLVQQNAEKKYAISSKSKTVASKNLTSSTAIRLTSLTDNGKFVSLGYPFANDLLWATGNLGRSDANVISSNNGIIVDPLEAGDYFKYGATAIYETTNGTDQNYDGTENPLTESRDIAHIANNDWRLPTNAELNSLSDGGAHIITWKTGWTSLGSIKGGYLVTSRWNGISLFFPAAGYYNNTHLISEGENGYYRSSKPNTSSYAFSLYFENGTFGTTYGSRSLGFNVRPVK